MIRNVREGSGESKYVIGGLGGIGDEGHVQAGLGHVPPDHDAFHHASHVSTTLSLLQSQMRRQTEHHDRSRTRGHRRDERRDQGLGGNRT